MEWSKKSEAFISLGKMPTSDQAGISTNASQSEYLNKIEFTRTSDTVSKMTYTLENLTAEVNNKTIEFVGTGTDGVGVTWTCTDGDAPKKYRPANCR